ncbi:MAG TPA: Mur ligase family protein [Steroidobacteraceae bacterium]|nr:Mur ligase family protein [Steroidobacteraceae bacterium]
MPFEDSRRLTGSNLFFDSSGAVLETLGVAVDDAVLAGWRSRIARARSWLQWPERAAQSLTTSDSHATMLRPRATARARAIAIRRHAAGTSLALAAPVDQLFTATEINEWAYCAALIEADPVRWNQLEGALIEAARAAASLAGESVESGTRLAMPVAFAVAPPVLEEPAAFSRFTTLSKIESAPRLRKLVAAADERALLHILDETQLTLGSGAGGRTWPVDALPEVSEVPWADLSNVPAALVTGSNGKTTTVRLLAACVRARGWLDGYNCTDGLFIHGEQIESGDYSGPVGTRTILRDPRVEAAVLETARGGILRRGLAAERARVAVITNISSDHFGEYGVHDLAGLADVKLVVASVVDKNGLLVLNADDPILLARSDELDCPIGWFSRDYHHPTLRAHRARGGSTSGVRDARLVISRKAIDELDLGAIADMPLTLEGSAEYNVSNIAGAALAALELGVSSTIVAEVLARFGADPDDNPGRLMRYDYRGAQVLIDYAHNPEGLSGLMSVAARLPRTGRLAILLGQAGNRKNADIELLAATAARFQPDFVVIKEIEALLRGRTLGETPALIRMALLRAGVPDAALEMCSSEIDAVRRMLEWARPGDVLVMPVHERLVRAEAIALVAQFDSSG